MYYGRRLRKNRTMRTMLRETRLSKKDFIYPLFLVEGEGICEEITSLPKVFRYSIDRLSTILDEMQTLGIHSCMLFGIPKHKDACGSEAYRRDGVVQQGIAYIKEHYPSLYVMADVCMCEYTDHGHCGILDEHGDVEHTQTLNTLNEIALSYARAGVDMVAPSAMMDGQIASIRKTLDERGYGGVPILGYSAKYASNYYGPFREAANSKPLFGDRKAYQMDYANVHEGMREIASDIEEGADLIMVKPALAYLDVVTKAKLSFEVPLVVYNVSGEYAMLMHAVQQGIMSEDVIYESILSMKRAGADMIITYFALYLAKLLDRVEDL